MTDGLVGERRPLWPPALPGLGSPLAVVLQFQDPLAGRVWLSRDATAWASSITGLGLVSGIAVPLGHVLVRMVAGCQGVGFAGAGRGSWRLAGSL
jgi:hypothetical protein